MGRAEIGPVRPTDLLRYTPMSVYSSDPRLQDGSDGISSTELITRLMETLHSDCRVLERVDAKGVESLQDDPRYVAMLEQLVAPMGLSFTAGDRKGSAVSSGEAGRPSADDHSQPLTVKSPKRTRMSCKFL